MTHPYIKDKKLRSVLALELWAARKTMRLMDRGAASALRFGMESLAWALQRQQ